MGVDQAYEGRELPQLDGSELSIGIVCGRFNDHVTVRLLEGALRGLEASGVPADNITIEWVPGAFEIPFASMALINSAQFDAIIGLGCVIRGDTSHYDFVAGECARGLQEVALATGVPVIFGVLTTENLHQAMVRSSEAGGHNVGEEGGRTAVEMALLAEKYLPEHVHDENCAH